MASGKSTLGGALARAIPGLSFVDLDDAVEAEAGMTVAEIFAAEGEAGFRRRESAVLRAVSVPGAIVACGGGTPCDPANMDFMLARGTVVLLEASVGIIADRLLEAPAGKRPLIDAYRDDRDALLEHIAAMLAGRAKHYSRAHARFDADDLDTADGISRSVRRFAEAFGLPAPQL